MFKKITNILFLLMIVLFSTLTIQSSFNQTSKKILQIMKISKLVFNNNDLELINKLILNKTPVSDIIIHDSYVKLHNDIIKLLDITKEIGISNIYIINPITGDEANKIMSQDYINNSVTSNNWAIITVSTIPFDINNNLTYPGILIDITPYENNLSTIIIDKKDFIITNIYLRGIYNNINKSSYMRLYKEYEPNKTIGILCFDINIYYIINQLIYSISISIIYSILVLFSISVVLNKYIKTKYK